MSSDEKCQLCEKELGDNEDLIIAVKTQNGYTFFSPRHLVLPLLKLIS